ncbi:DNA-processing protein DprA [Streptomyces boncukensis]|uniref:DNA-protecting protein DprA n=1 Tax=Streptomyces boncukensis TaxID=2711219 RepID=A0A6G4X3F8_9ACTN|nr:DNA-processing protein DprA [Streptomyces boncukensis]NGO71420.1 DNA-protecting protein DprA [Streptomyces boncukensis]
MPDGAERLARAALARVTDPGDETVGRWLGEYGPCAVVAALSRDGPRLPGVSEQRWAGLRLRAAESRPAADLDRVRELGGRFVCPGDPEWPRQLDDLGPARPFGLWVRGTPSLRYWALRSVAVVGARACTDYGAHVASLLGAGLAERGWTVVSGAAFGVDGAAHRGALAVCGPTVGVLACGVDVAYPPRHRELIGRLGERGLVVAELPPGDHPTRSRFVLRNRVIAALTRGTVVIEAALRSGSLGTARHALRLGRHTMGVPGPVTSGLSAGVHELLRGEATVVTEAAEVIELVGDMGELAPARRGPTVARDLLSGETARVLEALPAREAAHVPQLARRAGTAPAVVLAHLHELRALGFVERAGDGWQLTRSSDRHSIG